MEITCPKCGFSRTVDDAKIPSKKAVVHCKSCGHKFPLARARSIAVLLSKGGVGKTTTSVNLAAGLALEGQRVLLVDTDTQGQDAYMLGVKPKAGLTELVTKELKPKDAIFKARDNLWLLAGGKSLAGVKRMIDRKDFGGEMTLTESLAPLETQFDFIIIDSSPGWDPLTVNVLFYAKEILIPVSLEVMSLQGLSEFIKSLSSIKKYRKEVGIKYMVPTFMDERIKNPGEILEKLRKIYPQHICEPIRYNVRLSEAPAYGMTIFEYAGGSPGATDYKALVKRVLESDDEE
ncbi:AAA family ATPase [Megalodesulfovibrio gigas]|uniref:Putative Cobyrinic acid ac-diamide synthase n=1 Tax=Megalodesulfovibrio gigas (strain ATCC 19364 / DSM 1382 / NCIMB 9332 / VKM B-1759) TaxID=1121448 RepID=T2GFU0_MEGG1|nr:AAA family ATPase [Megalodesulfovibrio gigas]AGW14812.1 putative Cobyrinic acid ac-diamide synthase [Megalodesulfovibrio gigas DSM 1382 = ATCC 19364]